jgi:hypothetical protein
MVNMFGSKSLLGCLVAVFFSTTTLSYSEVVSDEALYSKVFSSTPNISEADLAQIDKAAPEVRSVLLSLAYTRRGTDEDWLKADQIALDAMQSLPDGWQQDYLRFVRVFFVKHLKGEAVAGKLAEQYLTEIDFDRLRTSNVPLLAFLRGRTEYFDNYFADLLHQTAAYSYLNRPDGSQDFLAAEKHADAIKTESVKQGLLKEILRRKHVSGSPGSPPVSRSTDALEAPDNTSLSFKKQGATYPSPPKPTASDNGLVNQELTFRQAAKIKGKRKLLGWVAGATALFTLIIVMVVIHSHLRKRRAN